MRAWLIFILILTAHSGFALAQTDLTGKFDMRFQQKDADGDYNDVTDQERLEFLSRANCLCQTDFGMRIQLQQGTTADANTPVEVWTGPNCDDDNTRQANCLLLTTLTDAQSLQQNPTVVDISVKELANPITGSCDATVGNSVWLLANPGSSNDFEITSLQLTVDALPPPQVENIKLVPAESGFSVSWELPNAQTEDIFSIQVLTERVDGTKTDSIGGTADYVTGENVCNVADVGAPIAPTDGVNGETVTTVSLSSTLTSLDETLIAGATSGNSTSARVSKLENGETYRVVLVISDQSQNATALYLGEVTPEPAVDFWEYYRQNGGTAKGGFGCETSTVAGWLPPLFIALALLFFRRKNSWLLLVVFIASTNVAHAQRYLDEEEDIAAMVLDLPRFNFAIHVGPYFPDIDSGASMPVYTDTFGDDPMWGGKISFDWFLLRSFGQLGLTTSIGFMSETATAFQADASGNIVTGADGKPARASGDKTSFRMMPSSIGVTYRLSQLDDYLPFPFPLVPYGKAELGYYMWWVKAPDGNIAKIDGEKKALGATMGMQYTFGLALRAEFLDPGAKRALRNQLGIHHAGFFFEYTYADIDGFGKDEKLPLNDFTWYAGINFEF